MDFVAIDFETANSNLNSACSMGIACVENNEIVEKKHFLIKPPNLYFDPKNIEIHGITPDDVRDMPEFPQVWFEIKNLFKNNFIIAHNAQFDMSVLKCLQLEYQLEILDFNYLCSIPISSIVTEGVGNSLKAKAEYFGIDMGKHHNSCDDAVTCASIVIETIKRLEMDSIKELLKEFDYAPLHKFSEIRHQKSFGKKYEKFKTVKISDIVPDEDLTDYSHPFYGKSIVFTGELHNLSRKEAMQIVANLGGILKSGVSRKTDFLVVGKQDKSIVGEDGLSSKEKKAYGLLAKGFEIEILNEDKFMDLISQKSHI